MSLTEEIIDFLTKEESLTLFCESVGVTPEHLDDWLFDAIEPSNINVFLDDGVAFKHDDEKWAGLAKKWRNHVHFVMKRIESAHVDSLVCMSLNSNTPSILKNIAKGMIREIDTDPFVVNEMVAHGVIRCLSLDMLKKEAVAQAQRDPNHVCENCTHCNIKRGECDMDRWWDISKVDIRKKYCEVFSLNTEKV